MKKRILLWCFTVVTVKGSIINLKQYIICGFTVYLQGSGEPERQVVRIGDLTCSIELVRLAFTSGCKGNLGILPQYACFDGHACYLRLLVVAAKSFGCKSLDGTCISSINRQRYELVVFLGKTRSGAYCRRYAACSVGIDLEPVYRNLIQYNLAGIGFCDILVVGRIINDNATGFRLCILIYREVSIIFRSLRPIVECYVLGTLVSRTYNRQSRACRKVSVGIHNGCLA